jgi:hypothetical protein
MKLYLKIELEHMTSCEGCTCLSKKHYFCTGQEEYLDTWTCLAKDKNLFSGLRPGLVTSQARKQESRPEWCPLLGYAALSQGIEP